MKHSSPAFLREKRSIHMGRIYVAQLCLAFVFVTVEVFIAVRLSFLPSNSYSRSSSSHTLFIAAYPWPATLTAFTNHQVDKLKVLADSLASSSSKAEQRILEHRFCFWTVWIIFLWHTIPYEQNMFHSWMFALVLFFGWNFCSIVIHARISFYHQGLCWKPVKLFMPAQAAFQSIALTL